MLPSFLPDEESICELILKGPYSKINGVLNPLAVLFLQRPGSLFRPVSNR
jgi:hypothetical protein